LRSLEQAHRFAVGLTYHTRADFVNGPWNHTPNHPPDAALIEVVGWAYAGTSGYEAVFGWDWYSIAGDVNDWSLGTAGTLDWTIELRSDTWSEWDVHEAGLRALLDYVHRGARGVVIDAATGAPVAARVEVVPDGAPIFTDPRSGFFHRVLLAGPHRLRVVAQGYEAREVVVSVPEGGRAELGVALGRADSGAAEHAFAVVGTTLPRAIDNETFRRRGYRDVGLVGPRAAGRPVVLAEPARDGDARPRRGAGRRRRRR
jgi:hypothetical protein